MIDNRLWRVGFGLALVFAVAALLLGCGALIGFVVDLNLLGGGA